MIPLNSFLALILSITPAVTVLSNSTATSSVKTTSDTSNISVSSPRDFLLSFLDTISPQNGQSSLVSCLESPLFSLYTKKLHLSFLTSDFPGMLKEAENMMIYVSFICENKLNFEFKVGNESLVGIVGRKWRSFMGLIAGDELWGSEDGVETSGGRYGKILGRVFNVIFSENENNSSSSIYNKFSIYDAGSMLLGVLSGLSADNKTSDCVRNVVDSKQEIIDKYIEVAEEVLNETLSISGGMSKFMFGLMGVKGVFLNCNLLKLGSIFTHSLTRKNYSNTR